MVLEYDLRNPRTVQHARSNSYFPSRSNQCVVSELAAAVADLAFFRDTLGFLYLEYNRPSRVTSPTVFCSRCGKGDFGEVSIDEEGGHYCCASSTLQLTIWSTRRGRSASYLLMIMVYRELSGETHFEFSTYG